GRIAASRLATPIPAAESRESVMSCNGFLIRTVPLGMAEPVTEALLALAETLK
ncbi:MAG: hypothetical protein QOK15_2010, partial [Nocardioidaceae bacterium]|nr:hypothetical protein [Nocardioidaceae bacterium]